MGIGLRTSPHEIVLTQRGCQAGIVEGVKALEFSSRFFVPRTSELYGVSFHDQIDVLSGLLLEKDVAWNASNKSICYLQENVPKNPENVLQDLLRRECIQPTLVRGHPLRIAGRVCTLSRRASLPDDLQSVPSTLCRLGAFPARSKLFGAEND